MTRYLLDTNVLIRFLLGNHDTHSPAARKLFDEACDGKCTLILTEVAVAEAVWVLHSLYNVKRNAITEWLSKVILSAGVRCMKRDEMLDALNRFASTKCDFLDCYLASLATASGDHVATFDKDFDQFDDVRQWKPEA
ncbi:MAG: type II toxin-antitoxin system VapC family toxin [Nitrospira sp. SB0677_bin_15]|nr:type II toxin-antitoxin system VapC family toxin [Nitrospira sp. SB0667_bin_9]MYD30576.1 type II toxin-antitoxin system VapC family toxin [Nitrospira sp. SB0661_bin_20]MYG39684.1 type II toxin-antitoxin system VapC family toxin [Nitrospira sp. SB0677_bin_15]MYH01999.1 type II toxin-antitoxin system VapC family toxin [Nitrospira sp. SB0675_bin_23]